MNIGPINYPISTGIKFDTPTQRYEIENQLYSLMPDTNLRTEFAKKVKSCIDSKTVRILLGPNNDILLLNNITNKIIPAKLSGKTIAQKFIQAVDLALKVRV